MQQEVLHSLLDQSPISLRKDSRALVAYAEKKTLPRASVSVSRSVRVATKEHEYTSSISFTRSKNINLVPFWHSPAMQKHRQTLYQVFPKP